MYLQASGPCTVISIYLEYAVAKKEHAQYAYETTVIRRKR